MIIDDKLWEALINLKRKTSTKNNLGWAFNGSAFTELQSFTDIKNDAIAILIKSNSNPNIAPIHFNKIEIPFETLLLFAKTSITNELLDVLKNYWPLSVLSHLNTELPYVFIHSATSLDGYLATKDGHSQWIGNDQNLIHAHRLRALFDAVLIGSNTVLSDKPSLNVRHVYGDNPKRLILSNKCNNLSSLKKVEDCETYLLRDAKYKYDDCSNHFDKIIAFKGTTKRNKVLDLLQKCKAENITSIIVEGGGTTLSTFIETKFAKTIQFHISPMLFGSGIKAIQLPEIKLVEEAYELKNMYVTQIGNSFMITASLV